MRLAARAGLNVAPVKLARALGKDVLLVERFDRAPKEDDWTRRGVVSALTLLAPDETEARYASSEDLATEIRYRLVDTAATPAALYARQTRTASGRGRACSFVEIWVRYLVFKKKKTKHKIS